jgi:hypothetical protein
MATLLTLFPSRRPDPPLPPLAQQAANLGRALARTSAQLVAGKPVYVSEPVAKARLAQCNACEHFRTSDGRCGLCGCWVKGRLAQKLKLAAERCPANPPKWTASTP